MNSEITDATALPVGSGALCYDAECAFCASVVHRFAPFLRRHGFAPVPLQTPWVQKALDLAPDAPIDEMKLILPDGRSPGGADAMIEIARKTIFGWPLVLLALLPGVRPLLCAAYRCVAARRRCLNGACSVKRTSTFIGRLLVGFGCLTFFYAAAFVFDVRPYLTNWFYRIGYHAINLVFVYLLAVYVLAAWKGGSL